MKSEYNMSNHIGENRSNNLFADYGKTHERSPLIGTCPPSSGPPGPPGPQGEQGPQGIQGPQGETPDLTDILDRLTALETRVLALISPSS